MAMSKELPLLGLAAALVLVQARPAPGQVVFRAAPGAAAVPAATQGIVRPAVAPAPASFGYRPYWGNNAYPYGANPYGYYRPSYLSGVADVYNSQGQYQISSAQAKVVGEQARQAKVDTQRKMFDEYMYEKSQTPTMEDIREQYKFSQLRRSRNAPTDRDIWSGDALNSIMGAIVHNEAELGGLRGPEIPLDPSIVSKINVTNGTTDGSTNLISGAKPLDWPLSLQTDAFEKPRASIDENLPKAVEIVRMGGTKNQPLLKVLDDIRAMNVLLDKEIDNISADEYISGSRFLKQVSSAVQILKKPGAENYFNGAYQAKGNTIDEVLYNMSRQGLKFAPVKPGDEAAYTALYGAIVDYDIGLNKLSGKR